MERFPWLGGRVSTAAALLCLPTPVRIAPEDAPPQKPAWQQRLELASASREAFESRKAEIRRHILVAAGLWPEFDRPPLKPVVFGRIERDGYTIEKVQFETLPGFHLTGNLYRPRGRTGPFPAVASPHGHWKDGRFHDGPDGSVPGRALTLARLGFVVFSYDMIGFGDFSQVPHRFGTDLLWGISPCGVHLWNSLRAVDFLASLPDVDPGRIGVTGASGGGVQTYLLTAVDDRIACAAPVCMVSAGFQGDCYCENATVLRIDLNNVEIAAATAPRPLLLVCATGDWTTGTPTVGAPEIREVYRRYDAEEKFRCVRFDAPHNYNQDSREAMYAWFVYWLKPPGWEEALERRPAGVARTDGAPAGPGGPGLRLAEAADASAAQAGGPPLRIPEPPFTVEKREDLAVWSPDHPLPAGAMDDAQLMEFLRNRARGQLEALRPRDSASLARFRKVMEPALREAMTTAWLGPKRLTAVQHIELPPSVMNMRLDFPTSGAGQDDRFAASLIVTVPPPNEDVRRLATKIRGTALLSLGAFERREPESIETFEGGVKNPQRYHQRTALAWRTLDILTAMSHLSRREDVSAIRLVASDQAAAPVLFASALAPGEARVGTTVIDVQGFDDAVPQSWSGDLYHPLLLRLGGLRAAGCLIAAKGGKLAIHNTQGRFDAAWIRDAFQAAGREADLTVSEEAWTADRIAEALK